MLDRLKQLQQKTEQLYGEALQKNPQDVDGEVTLLYELNLILSTMLKVGPEERMTKLKRLMPKIEQGLCLKNEGGQMEQSTSPPKSD